VLDFKNHNTGCLWEQSLWIRGLDFRVAEVPSVPTSSAGFRPATATPRSMLAGVRARVQGSRYRVRGLGFRVQGSGFRVQGSGLRIQGVEFRAQN